jgi:hypothetical protein
MTKVYDKLWPVAVAAGLAVFSPAVHAAQAVGHPSVYTMDVSGMTPSQWNAIPSVEVMPQLDATRFPVSNFLTHNALPATTTVVPGATAGSMDGVNLDSSPDAFGNTDGNYLSLAPYTIARASASVLGKTAKADEVGVTSAPWRTTGYLYFSTGANTHGACSASMIAPGLLVTAAHCVYNFGTNSGAGWHTNYVFYPALADSSTFIYGTWTATTEYISSTYYNGSDTCLQKGVSCNNDIAIIVMAKNSSGKLPGNVLGWYGYGWNGYSFVGSFGGASLASITQLGYPGAFDGGNTMERNDGIGGFYSNGNLKQTILGSPMTPGASGGPWLVNFGAQPTVSALANLGSSASMSVVGVTSWDTTALGSNVMGASWFGQNVEFPNASYADTHGNNRGAGNIGFLVSAACNGFYDHC